MSYLKNLEAFFATASKYRNARHIEIHFGYEFKSTQFARAYDIFGLLVDNNIITDEYGSAYREQYIPILVDEIDDEISFNALVVDVYDESLPVYFIGWTTEGKLKKVTDSLESYLHVYLRRKGTDTPKQYISKSLKKLSALFDEQKYEEMIEEARETLRKYEILKTIEGRADEMLESLGSVYNYLGIAQEKSKDPQFIASYKQGVVYGCSAARRNLMDEYCYSLEEYGKAIKLARRLTVSSDARFHHVKIDAYASLRLGEIKVSERCYRMLHNEFILSAPGKIQEARQELVDLNSPEALHILEWFGVEKELSVEEIADNRRWWDGLESGWQQQFKVLLATDTGQLARDAAAFSEAIPTDRELQYFVGAKKLRLHSEYKITTLSPVKNLKKLQEFWLAYFYREKNVNDYIVELAELSGLESLRKINIENNDISNVDFLRSLTQVEELLLDGNPLESIDFLDDLVNLRKLTISCEETVRDFSVLAKLTELRELELEFEVENPQHLDSLALLVNLKKLQLKGISNESSFLEKLVDLEELKLDGFTITDLGSAKACIKMQKLSVHLENLTDLSFLRSWSELEYLDISQCPLIRDSENLNGLYKLKDLSIGDTQIDNLEFVNGMTNLREIDASFGKVQDIAPLQYCTNLKLIYMKNMESKKITGLDQLVGLTKLFNASLDKKAFGKSAIDLFEKQYPAVRLG